MIIRFGLVNEAFGVILSPPVKPLKEWTVELTADGGEFFIRRKWRSAGVPSQWVTIPSAFWLTTKFTATFCPTGRLYAHWWIPEWLRPRLPPPVRLWWTCSGCAMVKKHHRTRQKLIEEIENTFVRSAQRRALNVRKPIRR